MQWNLDTKELILPAEVSIETLPELIKQHNWVDLPVRSVSFKEVKKGDSAILSLILLWAQNAQAPIQLTDFPQQFVALIDLYDLHTVVNIQ